MQLGASMNLANFGAVRRLLLVSAVLTLSPLVASAQIVERSQTWDNLIAIPVTPA
jgi:hypothetical protein